MTFDLSKSILERADAELLLEISKLAHSTVSLEEVLFRRPQMTLRAGRDFLDRCADAGMVSWEGRFGRYELTEEATSLAMSNLAPRVSRQEAENALSKCLNAARKWNEDKTKLVFVEELKLFGSFLHERDDYGDVDIEAVVALRPGREGDLDELAQSLPASARRGIYEFFKPERLALERESNKALKALKRSSPVIALAESGTIKNTGADWKQVYAFDAANETELDSDNTYHPRSGPKLENEQKAERSPEFILPNVSPDMVKDEEVFSLDIAEQVSSYWWGASSYESGNAPYEPKDDHRRHLVAAALVLDEVDPWPVSDPSPSGVLREVFTRGVSEGLLDDRPLVVDFVDKTILIDLPLSPVTTDAGEYERILQVKASWAGSRRNLVLTPSLKHIRTDDQEDIPDEPSFRPEHVAMARTLCPAMFEMAESLKPAGGVAAWLTLFWHPDDPDPIIPSIGGIMRTVGKHAKEVKAPKEKVRRAIAKARKTSSRMGDNYISIILEQTAEVTIRVPARAHKGGTSESEPDIYIESDLVLRVEGRKDSIKIANKHQHEPLLKAAKRSLKALEGLGSDWILTVDKVHRIWIHGADLSDEEIFSKIQGKGVKLT